MTAPARTNETRTRMVPKVRKASPPSHKPTTYNQRVRALNKTDSELQKQKTDATDPKALMRLYGTRRVPGLYKPYERTDLRVTRTYSERTSDSHSTDHVAPQRRRPSSGTQELEPDVRPSSAPSRCVIFRIDNPSEISLLLLVLSVYLTGR